LPGNISPRSWILIGALHGMTGGLCWVAQGSNSSWGGSGQQQQLVSAVCLNLWLQVSSSGKHSL